MLPCDMEVAFAKERNALRKGRNGASKNRVETLDEND